jgi:hypothetical protein
LREFFGFFPLFFPPCFPTHFPGGVSPGRDKYR